MSYQKAQNFKCRCPLTQMGVFGIHQSHQIPNIPCDRSTNDVFLNQHLQWYHNFDSSAARKLVHAICNNTTANEPLFSHHESIVKRNVSVESYKCKCPLTHDGVFGLSDEHDVTNVPCGRAEKEVLCFQHLQYHHNLSSRAAKTIVLALLSYTPTVTQLFHNDDLITQSKCAVRKLKSKCPLLARHMYGLIDQHQVPNIPCDRADQDIFLFHHLTYFHKLNAKAATKLIRALILNKSPSEALFHYNETIVVPHESNSTQQTRRSKKRANTTPSEKFEQITQSSFNPFENLSSNLAANTRAKYHCFFNPINPSTFSTLTHKKPTTKLEEHPMPLDCTLIKQQPYEMSFTYGTTDVTHPNCRDFNFFST